MTVMRAPAARGFSVAQICMRSDREPIHSVAAFIWGAMASPKAAMALVKVPLAASHRFLRVPSCALTRVWMSAWACMRRATSS